MKHHWMYLKYVLRHKWYVYQEGRKLNLPRWQLICHDLSKFLPDEWFPYARYFYGGPYRPWAEWTMADKQYLNWRDSAESVADAFDEAWLRHIHRNKHHWQHWILREDSGKTKIVEPSSRWCVEMVADWAGAGRAIHGKSDVANWYWRNRENILLSPDTRDFVETLIGAEYRHPDGEW